MATNEIPPPSPAPTKETASEWRRNVTYPVLVGVFVAVLVGAVGWYAQSKAIEASTDQRVSGIERRVDTLEDRLDDLRDVQQAVTALGTKVDAWRQADTAARAVERDNLERRLTRIEDAVDGTRRR